MRHCALACLWQVIVPAVVALKVYREVRNILWDMQLAKATGLDKDGLPTTVLDEIQTRRRAVNILLRPSGVVEEVTLLAKFASPKDRRRMRRRRAVEAHRQGGAVAPLPMPGERGNGV